MTATGECSGSSCTCRHKDTPRTADFQDDLQGRHAAVGRHVGTADAAGLRPHGDAGASQRSFGCVGAADSNQATIAEWESSIMARSKCSPR